MERKVLILSFPQVRNKRVHEGEKESKRRFEKKRNVLVNYFIT